MIGGTDIVIPAIGDPAALEACACIVQRRWPDATFEDADTGSRYARYARCADIPLGQVRQLFVYRNGDAEAAWNADSPEAPPNSMLYLIVDANSITAVVDDPDEPEMRDLLESIGTLMDERLQSPDFEQAELDKKK